MLSKNARFVLFEFPDKFNSEMTNKQRVSLFVFIIFIGSAAILTAVYFFYSFYRVNIPTPVPMSKVRTISSDQEKFGEPFGIVARNGEIFFSDGDAGKIRRVTDYQNFTVVTDKLNTPSQIAFDANGDLIVADSGAHTIKRVKVSNGAVEIVAGIENQTGYADGEAKSALFNAPIGVAVSGDKIFVADSYNDKIRVIENDKVSTLAGSAQGFADSENGLAAKFDTPCGLAIWNDKLLVADLENRRLRVVEMNGKTWTLAGNGAEQSLDGFLSEASFIAPIAVSVGIFGEIYVADGDSIRVLGRRLFASIETITNTKRGFADGDLRQARFNRPSGLAIDETGDLLVADAENQSIRILTGANVGREISREEFKKRGFTPEEFRGLQPARWTYNPPEAKREIAGTLGEIRGEIKDANSQVHFHNGLDVAGGFGETARFIRTEKVLDPSAVDNYATLRELIRMPTLGYIHISLGRDQSGKSFNDARFQPVFDDNRKQIGIRVPRGAKFEAGEAIGTLNPMNHVHLIAGRSGAEMNALDALVLPGLSDSIAPKIERVALFDENWKSIGETKSAVSRIKLDGKTRVVVRAYDRVDGNSERRKLGVYRIGYQILNEDKSPVSELKWTITFDRLPDEEAVKYVYAVGSKSGATGETIFDYIATNQVEGDSFREDFFDAGQLASGNYVLRVFAADFFGNITFVDTNFLR